MPWAPPAKAARAKTKRFTRRLLHREALALRLSAAADAKQQRQDAKRALKGDAKIDAALEGCEDW